VGGRLGGLFEGVCYKEKVCVNVNVNVKVVEVESQQMTKCPEVGRCRRLHDSPELYTYKTLR
jgi:hypothetical protein